MNNLQKLSETLGSKLKAKSYFLALAESCTGGLVAETITNVPGSSAYFDCGVISYSNESKMELLGVPAELLEAHGAVSPEVAIAMAKGLLQRSQAEIALSITGIAGPDGGSIEKPVGLVYFGVSQKGQVPQYKENHFSGDRLSIREQAAQAVLEYLINFL